MPVALIGELASTGRVGVGRRQGDQAADIPAGHGVRQSSLPARSRSGRCRSFKPVPADALGHHPYALFSSPSHALDRARRRGDRRRPAPGPRPRPAHRAAGRSTPTAVGGSPSSTRSSATRRTRPTRSPGFPLGAPEPLPAAGGLRGLADAARARAEPVPPDRRAGLRRAGPVPLPRVPERAAVLQPAQEAGLQELPPPVRDRGRAFLGPGPARRRPHRRARALRRALLAGGETRAHQPARLLPHARRPARQDVPLHVRRRALQRRARADLDCKRSCTRPALPSGALPTFPNACSPG